MSIELDLNVLAMRYTKYLYYPHNPSGEEIRLRILRGQIISNEKLLEKLHLKYMNIRNQLKVRKINDCNKTL